MSQLDPIQALVDLGFTGLEAEVYAYLLAHSPATGYRVAQALGKPTANTYKAIESLQVKGAVMVDEGATRVCRAVPTDELLGRLERAFQLQRSQADRALATLQRESSDDRVYQLRTRDQVMERCRAMFRECQRVALLDIFPEPLAELQGDIEAMARRGVLVSMEVYRPTSVEGVDAVCAPRGDQVLEGWPGQQLNVVTDAQEYLLALLETDGPDVLQAIWSRSTYLSCLYHSGLAAEIGLARLVNAISDDRSMDDLRAVVEKRPTLLASEIPGYQSLLQRYGTMTPAVAQREEN
jgi:sugar-specific transcriptional regulator TrmB